MVKIRLTKTGAANEKKFRVVATPSQSKRDGRFLEILGYWVPSENNRFKLNLERYKFWLARGAQPTKSVLKLVSEHGQNREARGKS